MFNMAQECTRKYNKNPVYTRRLQNVLESSKWFSNVPENYNKVPEYI